MGRYEAGETLASIARTYDCSPPAISYIVSRSRGKSAVEAAAPAAEPQLVKAAPADNAAEPAEMPRAAAPAVLVRRESPSERSADGYAGTSGAAPRNGSERQPGLPGVNHQPPRPAAPAMPVTPQPTELRRTLHLSLGNGSAGSGNGHANGAGNGHAHEALSPDRARQPLAAGLGGAAERGPVPARMPPPPPLDQGSYGRRFAELAESGRSAQMPRGDEAGPRKDGGNFIDQELRSRVDGDIAAFLTAFDAALAADTQESRFGLREATDRLLRAGARTRIELERLEARVPLPARERETGGHPEPRPR